VNFTRFDRIASFLKWQSGHCSSKVFLWEMPRRYTLLSLGQSLDYDTVKASILHVGPQRHTGNSSVNYERQDHKSQRKKHVFLIGGFKDVRTS
jgi:hypothetical protein